MIIFEIVANSERDFFRQKVPSGKMRTFWQKYFFEIFLKASKIFLEYHKFF